MLSKKEKKWNIRSCADSSLVNDISIGLGCSSVLSSILVNRGYDTKEKAIAFIEKSQETIHDPFLLNGMEKGATRILDAIKSREKITIFGDYDVDGVTSVSILYLYLEALGANVDYYIPSRQGEGYGMSREAIYTFSERGVSLIITVDTGVTAIGEIELANSLGIDTVVTDHHECTDKLPDAVAVINPKRRDSTYPFAHLAGVGVVFKLLCALEAIYKDTDVISATREIAYRFADLTAIGTIADVMPVIDENRIIVSLGLIRAENTDKIGLSSLISQCRSGDGKTSKYKNKKKLTAGFVGFTLAPRINAAGRISSASLAVDLFLSKDQNEANELANRLCDINKERQATENRIADIANEIIENEGYDNKSIIILDDVDWHHGVIGIVASRITDKYGVPSILISFEDNENPMDPEAIGKGSGRSISGLNLVNALNTCSDLLEKYGGHELAAGLSIKRKNLNELKDRLEKYAKKCFDGALKEQYLDIDCELMPTMANLKLASEISMLEPYGVSNATPVFAMKNMSIADIVPVGMNRHLKLTLSKESISFSAMLFSTSFEEFPYEIGDEVDIAFSVEQNEFNGTVSLQINVKDIKLSDRFYQLEAMNEELYSKAKNGECELDASFIVPDRAECAAVYSFLLNSARMGKVAYRISRLLGDILRTGSCPELNYVKLKFIIKIFRELNIVSIEELDEFNFTFKLSYTKNKTSLDKSSILKRLRQSYRQD